MLNIGIARAVVFVVLGLINLLPAVAVPASLQPGGTLENSMTSLGGYAGSLSAWVDWPQITLMVGTISVVLVAMVAVWLVRKALNLQPFVKF
jgi:hypothetical protein